jgi:hypothetical protein
MRACMLAATTFPSNNSLVPLTSLLIDFVLCCSSSVALVCLWKADLLFIVGRAFSSSSSQFFLNKSYLCFYLNMSSDLDNGLTIFGLSIVHVSISVLP